MGQEGDKCRVAHDHRIYPDEWIPEQKLRVVDASSPYEAARRNRDQWIGQLEVDTTAAFYQHLQTALDGELYTNNSFHHRDLNVGGECRVLERDALLAEEGVNETGRKTCFLLWDTLLILVNQLAFERNTGVSMRDILDTPTYETLERTFSWLEKAEIFEDRCDDFDIDEPDWSALFESPLVPDLKFLRRS